MQMDKTDPLTNSAMAAPVAILGVPFDSVTTNETIEIISRMIDSGEPHYIATANVDFLVHAAHDVELRRILFDAHLVLCDGTPLLWASRVLGNGLPERVAGSDVVPLLLKEAAAKGYRVYFLGAEPAVAALAVEKLRAEYPALQIVGHHSPPFKPLAEMDHEDIIRRIQEAQPDLLFVGFGCPKQEKWINMHYQSLGVPVCVGVGGTIDFLAGHRRRAPMWMRKAGVEWVYRMAQEPRRLFKRYCTDLWFFGGAILKQWWRLRSRRRSAPAGDATATPVTQQPPSKLIRFPSRLDGEAVQHGAQLWKHALEGSSCCFLDVSGVQFIDSTGVGLLIRLQKRARLEQKQLVLIGCSPSVRRALELMRLHDFFKHAPDLQRAVDMFSRDRYAEPVLVGAGPAHTMPVLLWYGEVTASNADDVWERTQQHLANASQQNGALTVDLGHVSFIDSTGLAVMIRARKFARRHAFHLTFTGLQPPVQNVLRLAHMEDFLLQDHAA
jgi:N-acetylglucosaminyldiphosphoundecaprenol N-acetyl-beta-D-mannosaminyltransferase